jgi:ferric enterobactin receptor
MFLRFRLLALFTLLVFYSNAQRLSTAKVDDWFNDPLDIVLDKISSKTGVQFEFDRAELSQIKYEARHFGLALSDFLDMVSKEYRLNYFENEKGVVVIFNKLEDPRDTAVLNRSKPAEQKTFSGKALKFNFPLTGKVVDQLSGESLPFVNITIKGTTLGTASNVDGFFNLLRVPTDTSTIVATYMGYEPQLIFLKPDAPTSNVVIELVPSVTQLQNVTVTTENEREVEAMQFNEKISMVKMNPAKLMTLPNIGERDIFRSFQLMPGISAAHENSAGLYVRGSTPDQALVLYDGFTVYHVDHLFGFYSAFNYNALKDVQLYKGGFEAKFGGRMASVVEITGKEGNQKELNFGGDLSLLSANLFAEIPVNRKLTFLAAGRRSYRGPIYNKVFESFTQNNSSPQQFGPAPGGRFNRPDFEQTVQSYFYDVNFKLTYRPNVKDIISWSVYNGTDEMDNSRDMSRPSFGGGTASFNSSITDLTRWGNTGSSLKWSRRWSDVLYGNTLISYSRYFNNRDRSTNSDFTDENDEEQTIRTGTLEDNKLNDFSLKSDYEWKHSPRNTLEFGAQITFNDVRYKYSQNDTSTVIDKQDRGTTYTVYAQEKIVMKEKLMIIPGIRANYYTITSMPYVEPRLSLNFQLTNQVSIKGATGRYYQFTRRVLREDILQGSREFWTMSDGDKLPVSYADHFIAGLSYETEGYLLDIEAYKKNLYGLSEYSLRFTPSFGSVSYDESFFTGSGQTHGVDFLVQKKAGRYSGWIGYTLSQTVNTFPVYQETPYLASQNVTHEFKTVNIYKSGHWDLSLTWIFASGKPYTAPTGLYDIDLLDDNTNRFYSVTAKNALRLPNYHRMDVAITYHWPNRAGSLNSVGLSFFNIYNRKNVWYREFQYSYPDLVQTDVHYMGFTPNVTVSLKLN